mmetsp:Transcript_107566/g.314501  ORF Transcript_107566/g.314501 Transcript_107566/m.314501 type:complete len:341 (+) Transcript_107566:737-1759(+)
MEDAPVVAVEPDLEVLEAVCAQREGVPEHAVALRLHGLRHRPLRPRPGAGDVVGAPRLGALGQLASAGRPEGDRVPLPSLPGGALLVVHLPPGDDVRHGAPEALGPRAGERAHVLERNDLRMKVDRLAVPHVYVRIELEEVDPGHLHVVLAPQEELVQLRHPDGLVHEPEARLHGAQAQDGGLILLAAAQSAGEGLDGDGIGQDAGLAPAVDEVDVQGRDRRLPRQLGDHLRLPRAAGRGQAGTLPDVIREAGGDVPVPWAALVLHRHAVDDLGELRERAGRDALPAPVALRSDVKGMGATGLRQESRRALEHVEVGGQQEVHGPRYCSVIGSEEVGLEP